MPKITNTKKQRAKELLRMLNDGPHMTMPGEKLDQKEITRHYKLWAESWIIPEVKYLIPELRKMNLDNLAVSLMRGNEDDEGID